MDRTTIFKTLAEYKQQLEQMGYNVLYIGLYGSQNYNVDDEKSDVDARAIILPSLHDIIFRQVTSKVYEFENGAVDVKDLVTFYDVIKKGNFSYVEAIDTEYSIGDKYIKELFKQFRPNLKSILGGMYEKRKALTHEYPSKKEEFEKWGFDPKQYHHIIRLFDVLNHINSTGKQVSYLQYGGDAVDLMIKIKRNHFNLSKEYAETDSDGLIELAKELIPMDYKYEPINIDNDINSYIENKLKMNLQQ